MSSDDIANLFRQFGGAPENYKELGRDNVVRQSRERWPLLATLRAQDAAKPIQPVRVGEKHRHDGPAPIVFDEAAAAQAAAEARAFDQPPATIAQPMIEALPREPVLRAYPDHLSESTAEIVAAALAPKGAHAPVAAAAPVPVAAPAVAGTELQGLFNRIARQPEPTAPAVDPEVSLLRRLLKP